MTEIVLNSEAKLAQGTKNQNMPSDEVSGDGLFNSLFGIITENSEDLSLLENNPSLIEEKIDSDSSLLENQENQNETFAVLNGNIFLNDFKKGNNFKNEKQEFKLNKNFTLKNESLEIKFEIANTNSKNKFSQNFSEITKKINDKSLVKNISYFPLTNNTIQSKELGNLVYKKIDNVVLNIEEIPDEISLNKIKMSDFKINVNNIVTDNEKDQFLTNYGKSNLNYLKNSLNLFNTSNPLKNQETSKTDNSYSNSTININSLTSNFTSQNSGSNHSGGNSFYSSSAASLEYLNMLDKSWGNNILNRLEKAIKNGDENIEISLKPRNLGKLKISLSLTNDSARINIITENSSAALLLSDAESKLSQMLENSGLKLSNLSTNSDQSNKHNTKNGNQDNTEKKVLAKDEISLEKGEEMVSKINSENQILNLLA